MKKMTLHAILIGEKAKVPLRYVDSVQAVEGKGLAGDRYFLKQGTFNKPQLSQDVREISIVAYDTLEICNSRLQTDLDFPDLRRNLVIKNLNIGLLEEEVFHLGEASFKIVRTCPPCRYLSRLLEEDMMSGLKYIGGYRAKIIKSGRISIGDEIYYEGKQ